MKPNKFIEKIVPEKVFLVFALVVGFLLTFITPPFQVADEPGHLYRAYEISEGHFISKKINNEVGNYIPKDIILMVGDLEGQIPFNKNEKFSMKKLEKYQTKKINFENKKFVDFRSMVLYSPIVYIPQSLGICAATIIPSLPFFPQLLMIYLGRIFNLLAFIVMIYYAIKLTPLCKWGLTLIALMPMTIYQAASLSADSVCFGLSFLTIAFILNCAFGEKKKIKNSQLFAILVLAVLLSLCKTAYFFIPFLFLVIPFEKIGSKKKYYMLFLVLLAVVLLVDTLWGTFIRQLYLPISSGVNPEKQFKYIIFHPLEFIILFKIFFNKNLLISFAGNLGWLDNPLPLIFVQIYLCIMVLTAFFENNKDTFLRLKQKIIIFLITLFNCALIVMLIYLSCSKIGQNHIIGLQGRYFIPIAPLFILLFSSNITKKINIPKSFFNLFLVCFIMMSLSITLFYVIKRYYLVF